MKTIQDYMNLAEVWIVQGSTGEYSDHCEWVVSAFFSEEKAKSVVEELSALGRDAKAERDKDYSWEETPQGKALLAKDPQADIDYTGINYTAYKVDVSDNPIPAMAKALIEAEEALRIIPETGSQLGTVAEGYRIKALATIQSLQENKNDR